MQLQCRVLQQYHFPPSSALLMLKGDEAYDFSYMVRASLLW